MLIPPHPALRATFSPLGRREKSAFLPCQSLKVSVWKRVFQQPAGKRATKRLLPLLQCR
jgi:hypothetical protein